MLLSQYLQTLTNGKLEAAELAESGPSATRALPLDLVDPNPANPRANLVEIEALADNIATFGLLQPVTVRRNGERYELIGGHRRRAALLLLHEREPQRWRTIDALIVKASDERAFLMLVSSQVHTRNWRPREEAAALERLALAGLTLKQIGERLNHSEGWASKRLRVYADSVLSGYVQTQQIGLAIAEELLRVQDVGTRKDLAQRAVKERWSLDQAKGQVRALRLDHQIARVEKLAHELIEILSSVNSARIPVDVGLDLNTLARRIDAISGRRPVRVPSIAEAQRAAHINPEARSRKPQKQRRTRFRSP
jgi:ParB family chromosome partitioning protein